MKKRSDKYKCLNDKCGYEFDGYPHSVPVGAPRPHPTNTAGSHIVCPSCLNVYVKWLNYEQDIEKN